MPGKTDQVNKMLSPEETSLLQDVVAGLNVLLGSNNAIAPENAVEGSGAQTVQMESTSAPKAEIETNEEPVVKSDNGPTANGKAEERVEDGTQITEGNVGEVIKALAKMMGPKEEESPVNKSLNAEDVAKIVLKGLEPVVAKIGVVEKDMSNMLDALGFSDAMDSVEKTQNPIQTVQKSVSVGAPVANQDSIDIVKMIGQAMAQQLQKTEEIKSVVGGPKYETENTIAHKSLGEAVIGFHTQNKGVN